MPFSRSYTIRQLIEDNDGLSKSGWSDNLFPTDVQYIKSISISAPADVQFRLNNDATIEDCIVMGPNEKLFFEFVDEAQINNLQINYSSLLAGEKAIIDIVAYTINDSPKVGISFDGGEL